MFCKRNHYSYSLASLFNNTTPPGEKRDHASSFTFLLDGFFILPSRREINTSTRNFLVSLVIALVWIVTSSLDLTQPTWIAIGYLLYFYAAVSVLRVATSDPGILPRHVSTLATISPHLVGAPISPYVDTPKLRLLVDGAIHECTFCGTCRIWRPPKAYHCSKCGFCINKHNHHCNVVGKCVGSGNVGAFLSFLISLSLTQMFSFGYCCVQVSSVVRRDLALSSWFFDTTQYVLLSVGLASVFVSIAYLTKLIWVFTRIQLGVSLLSKESSFQLEFSASASKFRQCMSLIRSTLSSRVIRVLILASGVFGLTALFAFYIRASVSRYSILKFGAPLIFFGLFMFLALTYALPQVFILASGVSYRARRSYHRQRTLPRKDTAALDAQILVIPFLTNDQSHTNSDELDSSTKSPPLQHQQEQESFSFFRLLRLVFGMEKNKGPFVSFRASIRDLWYLSSRIRDEIDDCDIALYRAGSDSSDSEEDGEKTHNPDNSTEQGINPVFCAEPSIAKQFPPSYYTNAASIMQMVFAVQTSSYSVGAHNSAYDAVFENNFFSNFDSNRTDLPNFTNNSALLDPLGLRGLLAIQTVSPDVPLRELIIYSLAVEEVIRSPPNSDRSHHCNASHEAADTSNSLVSGSMALLPKGIIGDLTFLPFPDRMQFIPDSCGPMGAYVGEQNQ